MGLKPLHGQLLEPLAPGVGRNGHDPLMAVQQLHDIFKDGFPVAVAADQIGLQKPGGLLGERLGVAAR